MREHDKSDKLMDWIFKHIQSRSVTYLANALRDAAALLESGDENEAAATALQCLGRALIDHAQTLRSKQ